MEVRDGTRIIDKIRVDSGFEEGRKRGGVWYGWDFPGQERVGGNLVFISQATPPELHTLSITFKLLSGGKI